MSSHSHSKTIGRWVRKIVILALGTSGVVALLVLVLFGALSLPQARVFAVAQANKALKGVFAGKIRIEHVGHMGLTGASGVDGTVFDIDGHAVLMVRGGTAKLAVIPLVWAVLAHPRQAISVDLTRVTADHVEVPLIDDGLGSPTLFAAFAASRPDDGTSNTPPVTIHFRSIAVGHAWVHGRLGSAPAIDAELEHTLAKLDFSSDTLRLQLDRTQMRGRALPYGADPNGEVGGALLLPLAPRLRSDIERSGSSGPPGLIVQAWFAGQLAGSTISASFDWSDTTLSAAFSAPHIEPASISRFVPVAQLPHGISVRATANGAISNVQFEVQAAVNDSPSIALSTTPATLDLVGRVAFDTNIELNAEIRAHDIDLAALLSGAPESRLGGTGHVELTHTHRGSITGQYDWSSSPGLLSGTPLPALHLGGEFRYEPDAATTTHGQARILEPGADTTVKFLANLGSKPLKSALSFESYTAVANPERLRSLTNGLLCQGSVDVSATLWPEDGHWTAQSHARLHDVRHGPFAAMQLDLRAEVDAGQGSPSAVVHADARDLTLANQRFRRLDFEANGTLERSRLIASLERDDGQRFALTTNLGIRPILDVRNVQLVIPSRDGTTTLTVDALRSSAGVTRIEGAHFEGAGVADLSLRFGNELERFDVTTKALDGPRLAGLLGIHSPFRAGRATLVAHYAAQGPEAGGFLRGSVVQVELGPIRDASADVDFTLTQEQLDGAITAQLAPGSIVDVSVRALPIGSLNRPELALATKNFSLSARGVLDLAQLGPWIQALDLPLDRAIGAVSLDLSAQGPRDGHDYPALSMRLETRALDLGGRRDQPSNLSEPALARMAQPWSLRGVDGTGRLSISGDDRRMEAFVELHDEHGTLVDLNASASLPTSVWTSWRIATLEAGRIPLVATLHMPGRKLQQLPPLLRVQSLRGIASLDASLQGSLDDPELVVDGKIDRLATLTERIVGKKKLRLDVSFHAAGSRRHGTIRAEIKEMRRSVGNVDADWNGDIARLLTVPSDVPSPVHGQLVARLDRFPLRAIPSILTRQLSGTASGELSLRDWGHDASFVVHLDAEQLALGNVVVERAVIGIEGSNGRLGAKVQISGRKSGTLDASGETEMTWGDRIAPIVDPAVHGELQAKGFQLGLLSPFLTGSINELEGSIEAKLDAKLDRGVPRVEGQATLSQGVIQVPSVGQRFAGIEAHVTIHDGDLRADHLQARGLTGRMTGSARARLEGLSLISGEAHAKIARSEPIPITIEGQAVGDAWGRVDVTLERLAAAKTSKIRVELPEFHLDLPDLDPTSLQDLDPAAHVRIGTHRDDGHFVSLPVQPFARELPVEGDAVVVELHLGNSVWIEKGPGVKLQLAGDLLARIARETTVKGRLELKGGTLDVSGKSFAIESGVVTFDGDDSGNPMVTATARWDSPTEYRVYAEYSGTVKDGRLTLRSQPPLSADKIVSLLLFGTPEGTFGASGSQGTVGDSTATAVGLAGDTAVRGLNRTLSGMTKLDVSARLDTSTGTARPELDLQLTPRVTARMSRAIGEPTFGQSPDRTFLTVEFRFRNAWALSAIVGDRGASALDLLWRRRY